MASFRSQMNQHYEPAAPSFGGGGSQMNQHYEPAAPSFGGGENPYAAFSWQSSAGTPDRSLDTSPCTSNTTLVDDEAEAHRLENRQFSGASSRRIQAPNFELNPYAATFVPSTATLHLAGYGYFPPPVNTNEEWLDILGVGMLRPISPLPLVSGSWSNENLCELAKLFCWKILANANMEDFGPQAARFARDVQYAFMAKRTDTVWDPSYFGVHLEEYALDHFKLYWCSLDNPKAISIRKKLEAKRWNVALDFSCFIADLFFYGLIKVPNMHECLGILLHEMVSVEHVRTVQAMVIHAGPRLWQTTGSHVLRMQFKDRFLGRIALLHDNANLTGKNDSIRKVVQAGDIISLIDGWYAERPQILPPIVKSIWTQPGSSIPYSYMC